MPSVTIFVWVARLPSYMKRLRLGSVFGIPVRLDLVFLLALPPLAYVVGSRIEATASFVGGFLGTTLVSGVPTSGATPWLLGTAVALGLFVGVVLHELGHSAVALRFGYTIESVTLWAFGGVASYASVPTDWRRELQVALAGPAVSVLVGVGCYAAMGLLPGTLPAGRFLLGILAVLNLGLAAFNLLPGFPMDGGRVLRALLARTRSYPHATRIAASAGTGFALLLGLLGVLRADVVLVAVGLLVYVGASSEVQQQLLRNTFEGITVRDIVTPAADLDTVSPGTPIVDLLEKMFRQHHVGYPVVRDGAVVGMVTLEDVSRVAPIERDVLTVSDVMTTDLKTISPDADVLDALSALQRHDVGRVLVTDRRDELVGLLSRTDLMRAFGIISQSDPPTAEEVPPPSEPTRTVRLRR